MIIIIGRAVITILLFCLCNAASAANLLTNASFEDFPAGVNHTGGTYIEHDWRYFSVNGANGSFQTLTPGLDGNIAIRLSRTSASGDSGLDRDGSLLVPAAAGQRYKAVVWARTDSGGTLNVNLSAYGSDRQWLMIQKSQSFPLSTIYKKYVMEFLTPANTAYINFAIRVAGTGSIIVDNCELTDVTTELPLAPVITYPSGETVDSFKPVIAFAGPAHNAYQVVVSQGGAVIWDSGEVAGTSYTTTCPVSLATSTSYEVKVRLRNHVGWSDYSNLSTFNTQSSPIVDIITPEEADSIRSTAVTVKWNTESPSGITSQTIRIDNGSPVSLSASARSYNLSNLTAGIHSVTLTVTSAEGTSTDSSRFNIWVTPAEPGTIYYYDLSYIVSYNYSDASQRKLAYDIPMAVAALQGLVNRKGPRLFVKLNSEDTTWWNRLKASGSWLSNKDIVTIPNGFSNLRTLFDTFKDDYEGAVVWDPTVYATANVACTVAGADDLIPIRYDPSPGSVYSALVTGGPCIPVKLDLNGRFTGSGTIWDTDIQSTGSKKNDAYIWARTRYLETGKCNPELLMYAVDAYWLNAWWLIGNKPGHTLICRDYVIMNRGFCFDLNVWADEKPVDDPNQTLGLDLSTFRSILAAAAARAPGMVEVVGFVPWPMKYTNWHNGDAGGTHDPVPTEWEYARWLTHYNAYMDADAYDIVDLASASIYCQYPLPDRLIQNRKLSYTELRKMGYVDTTNTVSPMNFLNIYMGDYDSACWMTRMATSKWNDVKRGMIPISWAFNPNLIKRVAAVYEYYNRTRTDKDSFIAGDCGSGYVNPSRLLTNRLSGLPSAKEIWIQHNLKYFRATNVKISGFLINGTEGPLGADVDSMYSLFSPDGTFSQPLWYPQGDHMVGSMPALLQHRDLSGYAASDADIVQPEGSLASTQFLNYRTVLMSPTYVFNLFNNITTKDTSVPWALIDTPTYAALASCYYGKVPDCRATYTFDSIPDTIEPNASASVSAGIRNEGWITWEASGTNAVTLLIKWTKNSIVYKTAFIPLPHNIPSGKGIVLDFQLTAPSSPGQYTLSYEIARGGTGFSMSEDYNWTTSVVVTYALGGLPSDIKSFADGTKVTLRDAVVTAGTNQLSNTIYVEDEDRASGIRVYGSPIPFTALEGDRVIIAGTLASAATERYISSPSLVSRIPGSPLSPIAMSGRDVGGGDLNSYTPGITGGFGAHNTGLLITVWGRVSYVDNTGKRFYVDDGSGLVSSTGYDGIMVICSGLATGNTITMPPDGSYVLVTGASSRISQASGGYLPIIRPRKQADIVVLPF